MRKILWVLVLVLGLNASIGFAGKPRPFPRPEKMENLQVYLLTVGLGEELYMRYGHTLLYLVNEELNYSLAFNWGMFYFGDWKFPIRFFMGDRRYWVDQSYLSKVIRNYQNNEQRKVWQNKVHLSSLQKTRLLDALDQNFSGNNIFFNYDHFYENCSTYVRDHLNTALMSALKKKWEPLQATQSLRDYVRINLNKPPFIGYSLDVIMNWTLDKNLNAWEEAFYPEILYKLLKKMPQIDEQGQPIPDTQLLGPDRLLVESGTYPSSKTQFGWFVLALGTLPGLFALLFFRRSGVFFRLLGLGQFVWHLWVGLLGILMFIGLFGKVPDIKGNWNLLFIWPVEWFFCLTGLWFVFRGRALKGWVRSLVVSNSYLHLVGVALLAGVAWLGLIGQNVGQVLWSLGIPTVFLHALIIIAHKKADQMSQP